MSKESKKCQNCQQEFIIESEDFSFYEKMKVPAPTWCPDCRFMRRMLWRNEYVLYKRKESLMGKEIFSQFSPEAPVRVYGIEDWYSDKWDPFIYGKDYDFSKPFFTQLKELLMEVPVPSRSLINPINSEYCMNATYPKNCYLTFGISYCENLMYVIFGANSKDSADSHMIFDSELCYGSVNILKCYLTFFSVDCENCVKTTFCKNCIGCTNCFGCVNLRNKSYYIFNKPYSKEQYSRQIKELALGSYAGKEKIEQQTIWLWKRFPNKYAHGRHNINSSGDYIENSKNAVQCYRITGAENVKYCQNFTIATTKDSYDFSNFGDNAELIYDSYAVGKGVYNIKFSMLSYNNNSNLQYCVYCMGSSNLFACIGLRNKQYCIFNKQYTKEEYEILVPRIILHMNSMPYVDKQNRVYKYGEFFPPELSPFSYNETIAQEYFPLTKDKAMAQGYRWRDIDTRDYKITIQIKDLPDHIKDVKDNILNQIIECDHKGNCNEQCATAFKIISEELTFYRKMNLPLPRLCPNCRHYQRLEQRNPLKLWKRQCMCNNQRPMINDKQQTTHNTYQNTSTHFHQNQPCPNEFQTSYTPEKSEIVYCEQCYNSEII